MSQLLASECAARRVESPMPKRQCCTRPGILGQRPPLDMAHGKRRKLLDHVLIYGLALFVACVHVCVRCACVCILVQCNLLHWSVPRGHGTSRVVCLLLV